MVEKSNPKHDGPCPAQGALRCDGDAQVGEPRPDAVAGVSKKGAGKKAAAKKKPRRGTLGTLRAYLPGIVLALLALAFVLRVPVGNLSSFGWQDIALICPVGALSTLLASKTAIPQALISLAIALVLFALFGRAFCSWVCSVPLVQGMLGIGPDGKKKAKKKAKKAAEVGAAVRDGAWSADAPEEAQVAHAAVFSDAAGSSCAGGSCGEAGGCSSCAAKRQKLLDSRHWILGGSLLSAAVFGFPVFCVVCPVGLSFAMVFLLVRLFSGSVSLALLVVPAILLVELVLLRKWCHRFCPIGALMSLSAKLNKTFVPVIDESKCIEATTGHECGRCAKACPERIDLRDLANGERPINECVKCRRCVDACPKGAISMPFLPPKAKGEPAGASKAAE